MSLNQDSRISAIKTVKKRKFEYKETELELYNKCLKLSANKFNYMLSTEPSSFKDSQLSDSLWMLIFRLCETLGKTLVPMLTGYYSLTAPDNNCVQVVSSLKNYSLSSTDPKMLVETLKIAQSIAEECKQNFAVVTYGLNIAKPAMQAENLESPRFDNVFIYFRAFHLFTVIFPVIGKLLTRSGGPEILSESKLIGSASVKGFLSGKHYSCKRIHVMFACHLEHFMETTGAWPHEVQICLRERVEKKIITIESLPKHILSYLESYQTFGEATKRRSRSDGPILDVLYNCSYNAPEITPNS